MKITEYIFSVITESKDKAKAFALEHGLKVHDEDDDGIEITDYDPITPLFWGINYKKNTFCDFDIYNIKNTFEFLRLLHHKASFAEPMPALTFRNLNHYNDITLCFAFEGGIWNLYAYAEEIT